MGCESAVDFADVLKISNVLYDGFHFVSVYELIAVRVCLGYTTHKNSQHATIAARITPIRTTPTVTTALTTEND